MFTIDHILDNLEAQPTYEHYIMIDDYEIKNHTFYEIKNHTFYEKILTFLHKTIKKYV